MKLKVLASGSKGNCYLLQGEKETLIIECGISYREILKGLNFNLHGVIGCLVTHEHKDHSKAIRDIMNNGIDVYCSNGTIEAIDETGHRLKAVEPEKQFKIGEFTILPFETEHDAAEPLGFLIQHKAIGKLLFATDTYYVKYKFKGLNYILVECNYSMDILSENLNQGIIPNSLKNRLLKSHFSLDNLKDFFKATDLQEVKEIVLIHLSENNSNANLFKSKIEKLTGKIVYIAEKGLETDLSTWL